HSDALFSAVCLAFQQLGWLEEWLNATANPYAAPAVRFSSCFPWQRGVLFAPPPLGLWPPAETPGSPAKLRWKGANLVPLTVIGALLRGETLDEEAWSVDAHSGCLCDLGSQARIRLPAAGRFGAGRVAQPRLRPLAHARFPGRRAAGTAVAGHPIRGALRPGRGQPLMVAAIVVLAG